MTDYTKLIEIFEEAVVARAFSLENESDSAFEQRLLEADVARAALQAAIEALQAENEGLKREKREDAELWRASITEREQQINTLRTQLEAMQRQEPVEYQSFTKPGFISCSPASWEPCTHEQYQDYFIEGTPVRKLYAAPNALEPLTDEHLANLMREIWGCASIAPRHAPSFARAIEAAHGIGSQS